MTERESIYLLFGSVAFFCTAAIFVAWLLPSNMAVYTLLSGAMTSLLGALLMKYRGGNS